MMGLSDGRKSFPIGLAVLIQYRRVTASHPHSQPPSQPRRCSYYAQRSGVEPKKQVNVLHYLLICCLTDRFLCFCALLHLQQCNIQMSMNENCLCVLVVTKTAKVSVSVSVLVSTLLSWSWSRPKCLGLPGLGLGLGLSGFGLVLVSDSLVLITSLLLYTFSAVMQLLKHHERHPACKKTGVHLLVMTI